MNINELAKEAGVSISTVSKAFKGSKEISESTKEKIFEIARKYDCFDKYIKQKYIKQNVAVICPSINSAFYCNILTYLHDEFDKLGYFMTLSISSFSAKKEAELINYYLSRENADAIIVIDAMSNIKYHKTVPVVALTAYKDTPNIDGVKIDFSGAICDAIALFKQNGHSKIAFVGGAMTNDKLSYFNSAMKLNHIKVNPDYCIEEPTRFESAGYTGMERIYNMEDKPTAILCAGDYIALGAIQCIHHHKDTVPDSFSIIGINDIPIVSHDGLSLTTINTNATELCNIAIDMVKRKLKDKNYQIRANVLVRGELVVRDTVKNINEENI